MCRWEDSDRLWPRSSPRAASAAGSCESELTTPMAIGVGVRSFSTRYTGSRPRRLPPELVRCSDQGRCREDGVVSACLEHAPDNGRGQDEILWSYGVRS